GMPRQEDVIWSGLNATHLFCHAGLYLWDYDVSTSQWTLVKDFAGAGLPAGAAHLDQHSRSLDDDVFGFSVK
ncbi:MAG: hypothetical protein GTO22_26740, partial [Gemmatimonadales bacterium]|nr:hypothetical protein [Gemmatimonadales bacterium]